MSFSSRIATLIAVFTTLLISSFIPTASHAYTQSANPSLTNAAALDLIYRQKYNDAITRLEQILEREPGNTEAMTFMATANLYQSLDFAKAQQNFEEAFKAGGGATFFVIHSHESFNTDDVVDYCRGWLHLRRDSVEYVPIEGTHALKLTYSQVGEFKRNRLTKKAFHITVGGKNQNFRGRSNSETEALLIVALYNRFTRN